MCTKNAQINTRQEHKTGSAKLHDKSQPLKMQYVESRGRGWCSIQQTHRLPVTTSDWNAPRQTPLHSHQITEDSNMFSEHIFCYPLQFWQTWRVVRWWDSVQKTNPWTWCCFVQNSWRKLLMERGFISLSLSLSLYQYMFVITHTLSTHSISATRKESLKPAVAHQLSECDHMIVIS